MNLTFPKNKKLGGANHAHGKCQYCPATEDLWSLHNDDHIAVCEKDECIDKGLEAGYHPCGCGG